MLKCPHCGLEFDDSYIHDGLAPEHLWFPTTEGGDRCPGSRQHPRSASDRRPLWKDLPADAR